jgi:drug/metabolite transporter (DMT)-like permease
VIRPANRWPKLASYTLVTIYFLGWSLKDVVIKTNLDFVNSATLSMVVSLAALLSAFLLLQLKRLLARRQGSEGLDPGQGGGQRSRIWRRPVLIKITLLNLGMGAALYTSTVAIELLGPVNAAVIDVLIYPSCLLLISRLLLRERVSQPVLYGLLIAIGGFAIFYSGSFSLHGLTPGPLLMVMLASGCYAAVLSLIKALLNHGLHPEEIVFCRFLLLGLLALVVLPRSLPQLPAGVWISLLLLGMLCYTLLSTLFYYGLKGVSATVVTIFVAASPLFSAIFTWLLIPGTRYTLLQGLGLAIIVGGLLVPMLTPLLAPAQVAEPEPTQAS